MLLDGSFVVRKQKEKKTQNKDAYYKVKGKERRKLNGECIRNYEEWGMNMRE